MWELHYPYSIIQIQTNKKPQVTFPWNSARAALASFLDLKEKIHIQMAF